MSIINLLKKSPSFPMQNRRQCQTSISKVRKPIKDTTYQQPIDNKQILLNTSKILKGNKIKYRQHLRTQLLKRKYCHASQKFIKTNLSGAKNINELLDDKFNQFQESQKSNHQSYALNPENKVFDNIQINRKSSSNHSRRGLKLFNQPLSQTKINKIIFSHKSKQQKQQPKTAHQKPLNPSKDPLLKSFKTSSNYQTSFPHTQQTTFRQILQSKQLKRPTSPTIKFMNASKTTKENKQVQTSQGFKKYQSENLDHRMNQYMNLLIHKTRQTKDIEIEKYFRKSNDSEDRPYQECIKGNLNNDQSEPIVHNRLSSTLNASKGLYFKKMKNFKLKKQKYQLSNQLNNTLNLTSTSYTPQKQIFLGKSLKIQMKHMLKDARTGLLVKKMLYQSINRSK